MAESFDVIVVGAGPAGSMAAEILAAGGARVCLLDKARFPRSKACGGAISPRLLRYLPAGAERVIRETIYRAVFTFKSCQPFEVRSPRALGYLVRREEFDTWLRGRAEDGGAVVREGVAVRRVERDGTGFRVDFRGERLRADWLIGADGASSLVAAQLLPARHPAALIGLQSELPSALRDRTVRVDMGRYPGGYAWAFPKDDGVNVGVMLEARRGRELREALAGFVAGTAELPRDAGRGSRPVPIGAGRADLQACAGRGLLLVGDAARLADPFLGEGIYYAVRSGTLAARAVLGGGDGQVVAGRYREALQEAIWPDLAAAGRLAWLFHRMPRWWYRLVSRLPGAILEYAAVLAGEASYRDLMAEVVQRLERSASVWVMRRLGLGAPRPGSGGSR